MTEQYRPKVVYDCMVFLQGLMKERGPAVDCLDLVEKERVERFISRALLREVADVLMRPELQDLLNARSFANVSDRFR